MTTIHERIDHYQQIWALVLPHLAQPQPQDAVRWCAHPLDAVEAAIIRAGQRFAPARVGDPTAFDVTQAYRYVSGTARAIARSAESRPAAVRTN